MSDEKIRFVDTSKKPEKTNRHIEALKEWNREKSSKKEEQESTKDVE